MSKKIWQFTLKDGSHTVELEHGYFSGKRKITVDGAPIMVSGKEILDAGSSHSFEVSGVPCLLDIESRFTFKYYLYVDGKPVNGAKVGRKQRIRQQEAERVRKIQMAGIRYMRHRLGILNIYFVALWNSFWILAGLIPGILFPYFVIRGDLPWPLVFLGLFFFGFFLYLAGLDARKAWKDVFSRPTKVRGPIHRQWIERVDVARAGVRQDYWIAVEGKSFKVSRKINDWLSEGDEVVVHFSPRTETVSKVEKLSAK